MGGAKRMLEEEEGRRQRAIGIALEAGVLEQCDSHDEILLSGDAEIEEAYRLGNSKFSAGELEGVFETRRQMTDMIKDVVEENGMDKCQICLSRMSRDD